MSTKFHHTRISQVTARPKYPLPKEGRAVLRWLLNQPLSLLAIVAAFLRRVDLRHFKRHGHDRDVYLIEV